MRQMIDTAAEFRVYLCGFDDGTATAWRTMADLVRAGVAAGQLVAVIEYMHSRNCSGTVPDSDGSSCV